MPGPVAAMEVNLGAGSYRLVVAAVLLLVSPGTAHTAPADLAAVPALIPAGDCSLGEVRITKDFEGGAFAHCKRLAPQHFVLTIAAEDDRVSNCSPWYGFRIQAKRRAQVRVDLEYASCGHRYSPKLSRDGKAWTELGPDQVELTGEARAKSAQLLIEALPKAQFVTAQELVTTSFYKRWIRKVSALPYAKRKQLGLSLEGRPIDLVTIAARGVIHKEHVLLLGGQHPPEMTGRIALLAFTERLLAKDELAVRYRQRFATTVIPQLNPDGAVRGHWRHNFGKVDLNRDWGPFTQPETRLVRDYSAALTGPGNQRLRLMIDFHSTNRDVIFSLPAGTQTDPADFLSGWLARYAALVPGYTVSEDSEHNVGSPVAKAWFHDQYRIPTATYELGDKTDRQLARKLAAAAAEAMMVQLLQSPQP